MFAWFLITMRSVALVPVYLEALQVFLCTVPDEV